jgi:hypothetical protein
MDSGICTGHAAKVKWRPDGNDRGIVIFYYTKIK